MLTNKQREVLTYIVEYHDNNRITPSFDEIKEAVHLKSKSGVHRLVDALVERGYITKLAKKARAIEILRRPDDSILSMTPMATTKQIPLFGKIAAGLPIVAICNENRDIAGIDYIDIPLSLLNQKQSYFALEVSGDSMIEAGILDGDIALFVPNPQPQNGQIVVSLIDGEDVTLKYYYKNNQHIELRPGNINYQVQKYAFDQVKVQGQLQALWRKYA